MKKGKKQARAARAQLKRQAAARSRKHDSDGLERYSPEATAGRSDLTALPELVRAPVAIASMSMAWSRSFWSP